VNDAQGSPVLGRTRWRRFGIALVPALAAVGAILVGMTNGAIAASISVTSNSTFKVSADRLEGNGFVQYGGFVKSQDGKIHPVAVSGITEVTKLANLCQSVVVPGTPLSLVIRAGRDANHPAKATQMLIDMEQLSGDAEFTNISIGQDASTLNKGPAGAVGQAGGFGQQADTVTITNLHQVAWTTSAGTFTLNGLDLHVSLTGEQCFP
jgi:hypothetical protein